VPPAVAWPPGAEGEMPIGGMPRRRAWLEWTRATALPAQLLLFEGSWIMKRLHSLPVVGTALRQRNVATAVPSPCGVPCCRRPGAAESPPRPQLPPTPTLAARRRNRARLTPHQCRQRPTTSPATGEAGSPLQLAMPCKGIAAGMQGARSALRVRIKRTTATSSRTQPGAFELPRQVVRVFAGWRAKGLM
jgi:hypothetical protein